MYIDIVPVIEYESGTTGFRTIIGTLTKKKCGIIRKDAVPLPRAILIIWKYLLLENLLSSSAIIYLKVNTHATIQRLAFKLTSFSVLCITFVILINEF